MARSQYLASLTPEQRKDLEQRLHNLQRGKCFICDGAIDLVLQRGALDIDHIDPLVAQGLDAENNFALTHASCNRSKGSSNLEVARRLKEFEKIQEQASEAGRRGADLSDILAKYGGTQFPFAAVADGEVLRYSFARSGDNELRQAPLLHDKLSGMRSAVINVPISYLHHDDRINPRSIGSNLRGLIEEFREGRPQLHVSLGWWAPDENAAEGPIKVFDGQHKAAAQILLGVKELPVRVFIEPDINVLLQANTNAGGKLRQVAFDASVMRHLGSTLYIERVEKYRSMRGLPETDLSFSERDLVRFYRGEGREMERYIIDAQRDAVTHAPDNMLNQYIEWAGKGADKPLAYMTIERSFFKIFMYKKALDTPIDDGLDSGTNPRQLERSQLIRLMSLFAEVVFDRHWDPDIGGYKLENRVSKGDAIPPEHLRAWRMGRDEVTGNICEWMKLVIRNHHAAMGTMMDDSKPLHQPLPEVLWERMRDFIVSMSELPCWIDRNLANSVFGPKQNLEYWQKVFKTGKAPNGVQVIAAPLNLHEMINRRS